MKKVYELEGLCCPNCAAKIEDAVAALDGVNSCRLTFLTKKMTLDIADEKFSQVATAMEQAVHRIEMDVEIIERS